ncbi:MAG: thiamine-phosphate kinase [bacterium]|nr:thiamine-phosphate kinase [bacterium]
MEKTIASIGEFHLIQRLDNFFPNVTNEMVIVGRGDDCAVIQKDKDSVYVATIDMLVEGVHFQFKDTNGTLVGRKAAAVNLSDIAAMGATPNIAFCSFGLPKSLPLQWFDDVLLGLKDKFSQYNVIVAGGNFTQCEKIILDILLMGTANPKNLLYRSGACVNDEIYITGYNGISKLGFQLSSYLEVLPQELKEITITHFEPKPLVEFGKELANYSEIHSCIDCSDGLVSDVIHICEQSQVGCILIQDFLPYSPWLDRGIQFLKQHTSLYENPFDYILYGGEDYNLIFTADPSFHSKKSFLENKFNLKITRIGKITEEVGKYWLHNSYGVNEPLTRKGWDHFLPDTENKTICE